jgi:hypothetical protein
VIDAQTSRTAAAGTAAGGRDPPGDRGSVVPSEEEISFGRTATNASRTVGARMRGSSDLRRLALEPGGTSSVAGANRRETTDNDATAHRAADITIGAYRSGRPGGAPPVALQFDVWRVHSRALYFSRSPPPGAGARRPHRLAAQDTALSRRRHGFESRWGHRTEEWACGAAWMCSPPCQGGGRGFKSRQAREAERLGRGAPRRGSSVGRARG